MSKGSFLPSHKGVIWCQRLEDETLQILVLWNHPQSNFKFFWSINVTGFSSIVYSIVVSQIKFIDNTSSDHHLVLVKYNPIISQSKKNRKEYKKKITKRSMKNSVMNHGRLHFKKETGMLWKKLKIWMNWLINLQNLFKEHWMRLLQLNLSQSNLTRYSVFLWKPKNLWKKRQGKTNSFESGI